MVRPVAQFGQLGAGRSDQADERLATLQHEFAKPLPFTGAHRDELVHAVLEQRARGGGEGVVVGRAVLQHAGPAQHVDRIERDGGPARPRGDVAYPLKHALERRFVDLQLTLGFAGGAQMHGAVDLAAAQQLRQRLAQLPFEAAQFLRQPEPRFEITVVDAAHLAGQLAPRATGLAPREAGHAVDHRCVSRGYGAECIKRPV